MKNFQTDCIELYQAFTSRLEQIGEDEPEGLDSISNAIPVCEDYVQQLRALVATHEFAGVEDEIQFFKFTKPAFTWRLIYYYRLLGLFMEWPIGTNDVQQEYLTAASRDIARCIHEKPEIYEYYRSKLNYLDHIYFVRKRPDWRIFPDSRRAFTDPVFSTSWDEHWAILLACEKLLEYIREKQVGGSLNRPSEKTDPFHWTGHKNLLVALGYAFKEAACVNNGKITIGQLMKRLGEFFNIPLTDSYKSFQELQMRKKGIDTTFDPLTNALLRYIERNSNL